MFFLTNHKKQYIACLNVACWFLQKKMTDLHLIDQPNTSQVPLMCNTQNLSKSLGLFLKINKKLNKKKLPWQVTYAFESSSVHKLAL